MGKWLQWLPALGIGLLIGWLIAGNLPVTPPSVPAREEAEQPTPLSAITPSALRNHLSQEAPLPAVPEPAEPGNRQLIEYRLAVIAAYEPLTELGRKSPYRAKLEAELITAQLPGVTAVWVRGGSPDAAYTYARTAAKHPSYVMANIQSNLTNGYTGFDIELTQKFRRAALRTWLRHDPAAALKSISDETDSNYHRSLKLHALMREWGELDPGAAAQALPNLPESGTEFQRLHFAESMIEGWQVTEPAAARSWIENLPDPEWREALLTHLQSL